MSEVLEVIASCTERGKVDKKSPYPPDLKDQDGVAELVAKAIADGVDVNAILHEGLMPGMRVVGEKFGRNEVFVPDLLMAAKAMTAGMKLLKPFFDSGEAQHEGTFVIGTVQGDLHDIGKNLVRMVVEGGGWKVLDLGVDTSAEQFVEAVRENPGCVVGLSALLTTTMINMENIIKAIREENAETTVIVGGAPLNTDFATKVGANAYYPDPQGALDYIKTCAN